MDIKRISKTVSSYVRLVFAMSKDEAKRILGLPNYASKEDVLKAWKGLAFQEHPDRGGDLSKMVEINVAKDVLLDEGISMDLDPDLQPEDEEPYEEYVMPEDLGYEQTVDEQFNELPLERLGDLIGLINFYNRIKDDKRINPEYMEYLKESIESFKLSDRDPHEIKTSDTSDSEGIVQPKKHLQDLPQHLYEMNHSDPRSSVPIKISDEEAEKIYEYAMNGYRTGERLKIPWN